MEMDFESASLEAVAADMVEICLESKWRERIWEYQSTSSQRHRRLIDRDDRL